MSRLGFEGTVEVHVNNGGMTPADKLKGYRGALYLGVGFASLGILIALAFIIKVELLSKKRGGDRNSEQVGKGEV